MRDHGDTSDPHHRHRTYLEVHLVPPTELIELSGRLYDQFRALRMEFHQLQQEDPPSRLSPQFFRGVHFHSKSFWALDASF